MSELFVPPPTVGPSSLERIVRNLQREVSRLKNGKDTGWLTPTLINGWANFGSGLVPARYRRLNGVVYVQGVIKSGAGTAFVLPVGFRPSTGHLIFAADQDSIQQGRTDVYTTGEVVPAKGANGYWALSGIIFPADQ